MEITTTDHLMAKIEALKTRKLSLAPEAVSGDQSALSELREVNQQIAAAEQEIELHALAKTEKQRRLDEAERQRLETETQAKRDLLATKQTELNEHLRGLEAQFVGLVEPIKAAILTGKQAYQLSCDLGQAMRWRVREDIARSLRGHLQDVLNLGDWIAPSHRLPLTTDSAQESGETSIEIDPLEDDSEIELLKDPDPELATEVPINV